MNKFIEVFFTLERTNGEANGIAYVVLMGTLMVTASLIHEHVL